MQQKHDYVIGYSLKANHNPHLLQIIKEQGLSVVTVSGFEIQLALKIGFTGDKIFFNGVGKQEWELDTAIKNGCYINVDSLFDAKPIVDVSSKLGSHSKVQIDFNLS